MCSLALRREFATGEIVDGQGFRDSEGAVPLRINARVKRTGCPAFLLQRQPQRAWHLQLFSVSDHLPVAFSPTGEEQCTPATLTDEE